MDFVLGNKKYGYLDPYLILEIGVNHEGNLQEAKKLISSASAAGANAVKFQTYKAELLASPTHSPAYWDENHETTSNQYELFKKFDGLSKPDYFELHSYCAELGLDFMSTPFDLESVSFLTPLVSAFKVASADITNIPLLRAVGRSGKPVILSTGASDFSEIVIALEELEALNTSQVAILHCVLNYPTKPEDAQLHRISRLQSRFGQNHPVGYSDHVAPSDGVNLKPAIGAAILGARIIEKHFTLDISRAGNDHYHSANATLVQEMTQELDFYRKLLGHGDDNLGTQISARENARRRVFANRDIPAGKVIDEDDLLPLRANLGIEVASWDKVVGSKAERLIEMGKALDWQDLNTL